MWTFLGFFILLLPLIFWNKLFDQLMFRPVQLKHDFKFQFSNDFDEHMVEVADGGKINFIHFKQDAPRGTIIYFHGNKGSLARWGKIASRLLVFDYDIVVMDYRGYGKSQGRRTEAAFYSDAKMIYDWVQALGNCKEIILYGRSLGSGIASWLAKNERADSLILENPYYSIEEAAKDYLGFFKFLKFAIPLKYRFDNFQNLREISIPVLIFHGSDDKVIKVHHSRRLHLDLAKKNIVYVEIAGGSHHNISDYVLGLSSLVKFE